MMYVQELNDMFKSTHLKNLALHVCMYVVWRVHPGITCSIFINPSWCNSQYNCVGGGGRHYKQINMDYQCFHNIIHVHNIVMLGMTIFHKIFFDISRIQSKYGKYLGISCGILSVPHNIVTDLYNVRWLQRTFDYCSPFLDLAHVGKGVEMA